MKDTDNVAKKNTAFNLYFTAVVLFLAGISMIIGLVIGLFNTFSPRAEMYFWIAIMAVYMAILLAIIASRMLHKSK